MLEALVPAPGPTLGWLDALVATDGAAAALEAVDRLPVANSEAWADVTTRRALWHMQLGHRDEAERLVETLVGVDPIRGRLATGDLALASGRPAEAEPVLREVLALRPDDLRALDRLSTTLAEQGRWAEAFDALTILQTRRPNELRWTMRAAAWRHRQAPSPRTLRALESLVADNPHAEGARVLARAYFRGQRYERALSTLGADLTALPDTDLILAARSLRQMARIADAVSLLRTRPALPAEGALLRAELLSKMEGPAAGDVPFAAEVGESGRLLCTPILSSDVATFLRGAGRDELMKRVGQRGHLAKPAHATTLLFCLEDR